MCAVVEDRREAAGEMVFLLKTILATGFKAQSRLQKSSVKASVSNGRLCPLLKRHGLTFSTVLIPRP